MKFIISKIAQSDIDGIIEYTLENWGIEQTLKYESIIIDGLLAIEKNPHLTLSKLIEVNNQTYRFLKVGKHNVFYRIEIDKITVGRILHQQMNYKLHL